MAFITLRQANVVNSPNATIKGSPLTNSEVDNNFANLNLTLSGVANALSTLSTDKISNGTSNISILDVNGPILITGNLIPSTNVVFNLGNTTNRFKDIFLSGNTINLGGLGISVDSSGNLLYNSNVLAASDGFINAKLSNTGVSAGGYGNATLIPAFSVGVDGRITAASNIAIVGGATLANDTSTNSSFFPTLSSTTSGTFTTATVSNSKLFFNPSTGRLTATTFTGNGSGLDNLNAGNIASGTLAVARGGTGTGTSATNGQLLIGNGSGFTLATLTGTTNRVTVTNGAGSITLSGPQDLATSSSVQFGSLGVNTAASGTAGEIRATNNITAFYSDRRLKTNITPIADALSRVMQISGVSFQSNDIAAKYGYTDTKEQVGVIAQDVEKVLPQVVVPAPFDIGKNEDGSEYSISGENYKTVHYDKLVPLLIEAIKELKAEVDQLKNSKG